MEDTIHDFDLILQHREKNNIGPRSNTIKQTKQKQQVNHQIQNQNQRKSFSFISRDDNLHQHKTMEDIGPKDIVSKLARISSLYSIFSDLWM